MWYEVILITLFARKTKRIVRLQGLQQAVLHLLRRLPLPQVDDFSKVLFGCAGLLPDMVRGSFQHAAVAIKIHYPQATQYTQNTYTPAPRCNGQHTSHSCKSLSRACSASDTPAGLGWYVRLSSAPLGFSAF